jgi:hypothetical protein
MKTLKLETVDINSILPDPKNARIHPDKQLAELAESLQRFGQQKPIVVNKDNIIIDGNGQYMAAKDILGWTKINIVRSELEDMEATAYAIAANQLGLNSEWDVAMLSDQIKELNEWNPTQNWDSIGFDAEVIAPLVNDKSSNATSFMEDDADTKSSGEALVEDDEKPEFARPIKLTKDMRSTIEAAINMVRYYENDPKMTEGRALELICADWATNDSKQMKE